MSLDEKWMARALTLAERGRGFVHPNPMVGAVLVSHGRVIAEGFHHKFGEAHAEVEALRRAGTGARGATLYVNLEPCAHWGKTPPCVLALKEARVGRVVAAMRDPNPRVAGKGFAALRRQGIRVTQNILEAEAQHLNRAFVTWVTKKRPYVTLKAAASLDGRTATVAGESKWITGDAARAEGHRLRAAVDAVGVGAGTVLKDNPSMTTHGQGRNPIRIVFAGQRKLPRKAHIFNSAAPTWILKGTRGAAGLRKELSGLAARGIAHLLVEGGWTLQQSFLNAGLVDEVCWFVAPMIIGNNPRLKNARMLENIQISKVGGDFCIRGRIASPRPSPYGRGRTTHG